MLDRLIRGLVGHKPAEFGRRFVSAVAGPTLTPLAKRVLDYYRNTPPPPGAAFQEDARILTEELLRETDPLELVASLVISLPVLTVKEYVDADAGRRYQVENGYHSVISHGLNRLAKIPVADWRLTDRQIAAALDSYERILLANPHVGLQSRVFLAGLMKCAASGGPVHRGALVVFIDAVLQGKHLGASQVRIFVDENLPGLGIAPEEIPILARWAAKSREVQLVRDKTIADAGPLLGPVLDRVLDDTGAPFRARANQDEALQKLFDADAPARGAAFSHLLDLIVTSSAWSGEVGTGSPTRPCATQNAWSGEQGTRYDNLQAIARFRGYFSHELEPDARPTPPLNWLAIEMSKRKMDLGDPDRDHARLVFLLGNPIVHRYETNRLILNQLLKTVQAHPDGHTAKALKKLIELPSHSVWAADVREVLRDGARQAGSDPEKAASLPPIELPVFSGNFINREQRLEEHFANLLEPRLYDQAHCDFLDRLAKLADAIEALPGGNGGGQERAKEINRLIAGFGLRQQLELEPVSVPAFVNRGRVLHRLHGVFRPLVLSDPDTVAKLASLAHQIDSRSAPSAKWMKDIRSVRDMLPEQNREDIWLDHVRRITEVASPYAGYFGVPGEAYLRTMIYLAATLPAADVGPMLTNYALKQCYVTRRGSGIRAEKLGNACVWSLAELPDGAGVPYLARVLARVKYPKIKSRIDAKLNEAAQKAGMGRAELDEIAVPTHGLDRDGSRRVAFAQGEAVFCVVGNGATLTWFNEVGKQLKSPSKAMKDEKELFKEVQSDLKELDADLAIQPQRLQQFYLQSRRWPTDIWRARYLDHPLVRGLALKLVWWIDTADGQSVAALPNETGEALLDVAGNPVSLDGATVRLWHPMDADVAGVEAWRDRLEALQLTQPFAQVWREVYALTDAERATGTYTNRWAAHILKQHQAMTLARLNGWRVTHRMCVDAANNEPWHVVIPAHSLVADYWVQGTGGDHPQLVDSAAYAYVSTDRVQFHRIPEGATDSATGPRRSDPVPLAEIPPVVYSEIMRHADLFTAVASIAADPNWLDQGGDAAHPSQWGRHADDYWRDSNTAALVESGKRRRAMLERIVPRLKIAAKLKLEDRYLVVQGTRHEYAIHLGSGACSRDARHICIVPKSSTAGDKIWLPFEGDRTLSIIISKAMLLAADDKITDPVILRQL